LLRLFVALFCCASFVAPLFVAPFPFSRRPAA
jgi:hypothetical protein